MHTNKYTDTTHTHTRTQHTPIHRYTTHRQTHRYTTHGTHIATQTHPTDTSNTHRHTHIHRYTTHSTHTFHRLSPIVRLLQYVRRSEKLCDEFHTCSRLLVGKQIKNERTHSKWQQGPYYTSMTLVNTRDGIKDL